MRYKQGQNREEELVLPKRLEDYVSEDNPARAIDVYVDSLDLAALGFQNTKPKEIDSGGQPPYPPAALLKLYLYGYLNRIRSCRRLEQECHRNLEVIWLIQELKPTYKTIADFRKNNLKALKAVNRDFVMLCKQLGLYGAQLVHIDGSFFRGNASKDSTYTKNRLEQLLTKVDADIDTYLTELSETDKEKLAKPLKVEDLQAKLKDLEQRRHTYQSYLERIEEGDDTQVSVTDEDARLLKKNGQQVAGYNVQTAVDDKYKLLVIAEVTNDGNDMKQLAPIAIAAQKTLATNHLGASADKGYYNQQHLKICEDAGITVYVGIPDKNQTAREQDRFERCDFQFDATKNCYICPANETLQRHGQQNKNGKIMHRYAGKTSVCSQCALKGKCLPNKMPYRQIYRWEHEDVVERHQQRMDEKGADMMKQRSAGVEHVYGTLKLWCGWTHFLMRGLEKVQAEMDLLMLCYNFKRVLNIIGVGKFRQICELRAQIALQNSETAIFFLFLHLFSVHFGKIKFYEARY